MRVNRLNLFACLALLSGPALGATAGDPVSAAGISYPASIKQMGMAGVSMGAPDFLKATTNPALLSEVDSQFALSAGGGSIWGGEQSAGMFGGMWRATDDLAVAFVLTTLGTSVQELNSWGASMGEINTSTMVTGLSASYRWKSLAFGLGVKGVNEDLAGNSQGTGAVDAGVTWQWNGFRTGMAIRNAGGKIHDAAFYPDTQKEIPGTQGALPTEFRFSLGYGYEPFHLAGGLEVAKRTWVEGAGLGIGLEWWPHPMFGLRGGLEPAGQDEKNGRLSFGLSMAWKDYSFDYALETHALGLSNRLGVSWMFGNKRGVAGGEPAVEEKPREEPVRQAEKLPPPPSGKKLNFAIADLRGENVSAGDAAVMADLLRNELVKTNTFTVIEKQNMDKVLSEHAFQQTGCSSEECAVKLGKLLNVQRMAVGSFGKLMDSYILSIRVVNVETGEIVYADSAEGEKVSQLRVGVKDMAGRMARQIR
jgi:hypothetical protein